MCAPLAGFTVVRSPPSSLVQAWIGVQVLFKLFPANVKAPKRILARSVLKERRARLEFLRSAPSSRSGLAETFAKRLSEDVELACAESTSSFGGCIQILHGMYLMHAILHAPLLHCFFEHICKSTTCMFRTWRSCYSFFTCPCTGKSLS